MRQKTYSFLTELLKKKYSHIISSDKSPRSTETIIREIIQYYEDIIGCMPGNVYWLDRNCLTLGCNKNVLDMFGFTSLEQFKGLSFESMAKINHWSKEAMEVQKSDSLEVIKTGKPKLNIEEPPITNWKGETIYFLSNRVPLFDKYKNVIGIVGISVDITDRKKMEENLRQAKEAAEASDHAKTEFLVNMRHDLRTPVTGIIGFANLIKSEANKIMNNKIAEFAHNIQLSSEALLDLLNEILEAMKVSSKRSPILQKVFSLKLKLEQVITLNLSKSYEKKLFLNLIYDDEIPTYVVSDPQRVQRIVLDLVTNAIKFTNVGKVEVSAKLEKIDQANNQAIVKISVMDTGIGIRNDKLDEIFHRFVRLNPSFEGVYKGLGLGLSIVKQFVEDLNGEINVISQLNEGSVFTCYLPLKIATPAQVETFLNNLDNNYQVVNPFAHKERVENIPLKSFNKKILVLVVEDNEIAAKVIKVLLEDEFNCEVELAVNGIEAVEYATKKDYDLIFMDIGLPLLDGKQATQEIRKIESKSHRHTPIIALTAHVDLDQEYQCINAGIDCVLSKPLSYGAASNILYTFIPGFSLEKLPFNTSKCTQQVTFNIKQLPENALELEHAIKKMGKLEAVKELLNMLIDSLPKELALLEKAHNEQDWPTIKNIIHKLKGGCVYVGAIRLQMACDNLQNSLNYDNNTLREQCYHQLIDEIYNLQNINTQTI